MYVCARARARSRAPARDMTQVQIDKTSGKKGGDIQLGVLTDSPDTLTLPRDSWISSPAVLCVVASGVLRFGHMVSSACSTCPVILDGLV